MAKDRRELEIGTRLRPTDPASYPLSKDGDILVDSTDSDRLKIRQDGTDREVTTNDDTQTLENKTIDGTDATGTNTVTADADDITYDNGTSGLIATDAQAAIDELKATTDSLGNPAAIDVTYDNTSSGISATNVQDAIDDAILIAGGTPEADDVIYDNTTSGLTATNVQAAIDEVVATTGSPAASSVTYDNSGSGLTATDVQGAIDEVDGNVDANTSNISNHVSASSDVHGIGVGNDVVGTGTTQTLENKTLTSPDINSPDIDGGTIDGSTIATSKVGGGTASTTNKIIASEDTKANLDALARERGSIYLSTDELKLYFDDGTQLVDLTGGGMSFNSTVNVNASGYTVPNNTYFEGSLNVSFGDETLANIRVTIGEGSLITVVPQGGGGVNTVSVGGQVIWKGTPASGIDATLNGALYDA